MNIIYFASSANGDPRPALSRTDAEELRKARLELTLRWIEGITAQRLSRYETAVKPDDGDADK